MSVIYLLKNYAYASAPLAVMRTEWVRFPADFELAQLIVDVKSQEGTSGAVVELETSWDMDTVSLVPMTALTTGTPIVSIRNITSAVGPLVRLKLTAVAGVQSVVNMNIYLTPKRG
ncbi:MAG: hypothetical protein IT348_00220 [Candidatus Eisenbacteria bacterium]|nr:hypothetical protein [Candidatus Eisenbacteria bacterium]